MAEAVKNTGSPRSECLAYQEMARDWQLVRDLMGGTRAMQEAGQRWLPKWPKESVDRYAIRLSETTLFNGHRFTIETMVAKVFRKAIALNTDIPPDFVDLLDNVDFTGRNLDVFCHAWFKDGLQLGLSHVLVDKSSANAVTNAQAKASGVRPYWTHVPAENLIYWRPVIVNGRHTLAEIRLLEPKIEQDGEWKDQIVSYVRRLWLENGRVHWAVYKELKRSGDGIGNSWKVEDHGVTEMPEIPLVTFYSGRSAYMTARPPLLDQAWTNLAHWRATSRYEHVLNLGCRPALYFLGFGADEVQSVEIGPHSGIQSTNPAAKVGFAEITGSSIGVARQHLLDLKEEMAMQAAAPIVKKAKQMTATESANDASSADSLLGAIVNNHQDAVNNALRFTAMWQGKEDGGTISMPSTFGVSTATAHEISALMHARTARQISWELFMTGMKEKGVISEDWDLEAERAMLDQEPLEL